ncbi:MAG TPA: anthranilate synthase family protein [Actinophytocola sp.]|uniref:anthranilate synthase family protein n=1 Tax=Actinophytocola sp. TaxID=1872138 RepID=UPI002F95BFD8
MTDPFGRVLAGDPPSFALLHRPHTGDRVDVLLGTVSQVDTLADIPVTGEPGHQVLAVIPFRQLAERGFAAADDGAPLLTMEIGEQDAVGVAEALRRLPDVPIDVAPGAFDTADDDYADLVRAIVADEIGQGKGANFVIKRTFVTDIAGYSPASALTFFRRLLERESGAYWTFVVHTPERTFVGASPERHVSLDGGVAVMNPISGTYRYPPAGPSLPDVLAFLADRKETDELFMVVDEELKMMARVCDTGPTVIGPYLKEMSRLAHTEYLIEGRTSRDVRDILRETLFAPTVTGSPVESACRVINTYEPHGRGYYSGAIALIGRDDAGERTMDSAILIRTADIDRSGRVRIGVGATLVRHSDPESEVAETKAKAAGLLAALGAGTTRFGTHPQVRALLDERNGTIARFWREPAGGGADPELAGRRVLIVDAEDTFTSMIARQLRSLGLDVAVRRFDEPYDVDEHELVVMGPGPGDPTDLADPKIAALRTTIGRLLDEDRPFLAVCLSHQTLCALLGLELVRRAVPNQGLQKEIDLFGRRTRVGFYNTFAGHSDTDLLAGGIEVCRDRESGEIHALRAASFHSMQFHAESVLTADGVAILRDALTGLLRPAASPRLAA